jgi:molybdate transport system substrate-binding protein
MPQACKWMEETVKNLVSHLAGQEYGPGRPSRRKFLHLLAAKFGFIALLAQGVAANAAEVKVLAGAVMPGVFAELGPQFERVTGHKIVIQYGPGAALRRQIEAGEAFDLAIIASERVDDLIKQGKIAGDTRMDIVRVGIGVAVREGAPKPDISSVDAFKRMLLSVKSVTYGPADATGEHFIKLLDRLGIADQVKGKLKPSGPDRVAQVVAAGEVDLAIGAGPLLASAKGVQFVGLFPAELQNWFVNTAGVSATARQPDAARALIKHLTTPEAAAVIRAKGMEPPGR